MRIIENIPLDFSISLLDDEHPYACIEPQKPLISVEVTETLTLPLVCQSWYSPWCSGGIALAW